MRPGRRTLRVPSAGAGERTSERPWGTWSIRSASPVGGAAWLGTLHVPDDDKQGRRYPAVVMCHGLANDRDESGQHTYMAQRLEEADTSCCASISGAAARAGAPRGRMLVGSEWPQDLRSALTVVSMRPEVDPARIGVLGSSAGGAVAYYTAATDRRIRCVVALGSFGSGEELLRQQWLAQHGEDGWRRFLSNLEADRARRVQGQPSQTVRLIGGLFPVAPEQVPFYDAFLAAHPNMVSDVPLEVADDLLAFRPEELVHLVAPIPLQFIHGTADPICSWRPCRPCTNGQGRPRISADRGRHPPTAFAGRERRRDGQPRGRDSTGVVRSAPGLEGLLRLSRRGWG
jgi:fermentation-respiration switch protein FrsA (DUF1100 family)